MAKVGSLWKRDTTLVHGRVTTINVVDYSFALITIANQSYLKWVPNIFRSLVDFWQQGAILMV
jgi:hypothetical protein